MKQSRPLAFFIAFVVAFVALSALADRGGGPPHVMTGRLNGFEAGEWISVANDQTGPRLMPVSLREQTVYEGNMAALKPGARVTLWYRVVGERRFVVDKVRVN